MKRLYFELEEVAMADFKMRLIQDKLTMADFFRGMVAKYIESDDNILDAVDEIKKEKEIPYVIQRKHVDREKKKGDDTKSKFGLNPEDFENIFNILEEEFPEL